MFFTSEREIEMIFEKLKFDTDSNRHGAELGINVHGYWVPKSVFEFAQKLIDATFHRLTWEKHLKVNDICFHPDWDDWELGLRIKLGRCLVHFVELGMLPLVIINPGKKGPRRYRRK